MHNTLAIANALCAVAGLPWGGVRLHPADLLLQDLTMAKQWFVRRGDKVSGPFHSAELKALATNGQVTESTLVALQESGPWVKADKVRGLFATRPAAPRLPAEHSLPADPITAPQQALPTATPANQEPAGVLGEIPARSSRSPLQKTYPIAVLTRCGGEMLVTVGAAGSLWHGDRWSFFIKAKTDKKGEMKATIEYGPDKDGQKSMRARRTIADFSTDDVEGLACAIVNQKIKQTGSTVWKTRNRSVNYSAMITVDYAGVLRKGAVYVVSLQSRTMRLDSSTRATQPCTAEITQGRKLWETPSNGLGIDDAYNALDRLVNDQLCGEGDDEDEDEDN